MILLSAVLGLIIGSFLNVCVYRIPRGSSLWWPPSFCPGCGSPLQIRDMIPVISFALIGGRSRCCRQPISWRYPLIEMLTAVGFACLTFQTGPKWHLLPQLILFSGLMAASAIDLELRIVPNRLLVWLIIMFVMMVPLVSSSSIINHLAGAGAAVLMLMPAWLIPGGMGGGDVKLAAVIGLYLGWPFGILALFLGIMGGALGGLIWMASTGGTLKTALPFAPFISLGTMVAMLCGTEILAWYQGFF